MSNKYNAKKKGKNDSGMEYDFAQYLKSKGIVFQEQVTFNLQEKFEKNGKKYKAIDYKADFQVCDVVIDIKGFVTTDFAIKKKLFEYKYSHLTLKCVRTVPKWVVTCFNHSWIELDEEKKLKKIVNKFKKENNYKIMNVKYVTKDLIAEINEKVKFYEILKGE